jgi:hypothetical protein
MNGFTFPEPYIKCFNLKNILCIDCDCGLCQHHKKDWEDKKGNLIMNKNIDYEISSNNQDNKNINNISLMYYTNYSYKNLWSPFMQIKKKYMNFNIKTYFCTDFISNNKEDDEDFSKYNVNILKTNECSDIRFETGNTLKRFNFYLNEIEEDLILFILDDMFFVNNIDKNKFLQITNVMHNFSDIGVIKLSLSSFPFYNGKRIKLNDLNFVEACKSKDKYLLNLQPFIIRKNLFIELIKYLKSIKNTTISQLSLLEAYGTEFLKKSTYKVLRCENDIFPLITSMGIVSGSKLVPRYYQWSKHENIKIKNKEGFIINDDMKKYMEGHATLQ